MSAGPHRLIGAEVSYYSGKVRAYLRYKRVPFEEVAATREIYRDVIVPRTGVAFIPVLISDDDVAVQDSSAIIEYLERRHPENGITPRGAVQQLVALLIDVYADEWLVLPAMHYRWNVPENRAFAVAEFGRLSAPAASAEQQRAIGEKLSGPFAGALPALGVDATTAPAIENSYRALLADLDVHLSQHAYALGGRPSLADFALYGPLYAHLYRDPASGRLMRKLAPHVASWVERMTSPGEPAGEFLDDDTIPHSLEPVLARMFRELGPVLASTLAHLRDAPRQEGPLPRVLGMHAFELEGVIGQRAVFVFNAWRWQRAHDHHRSLPEAARQRADALLDAVGGTPLMRTPLPVRLERVANRLRLCSA